MDLLSPSVEPISEDDSACVEQAESDTPGPSSTSTGSEIKPQKEFFVHKVTKLDTLAGLAVRYGLSVFDIKKANGLASENSIYARETLIIPLHPSATESGRMGVDGMQPWSGLSSISERGGTRYAASTSQASTSSYSRTIPSSRSAVMWDSFMAVDDHEHQSVSEIELEMMDEESLRRQVLLQKQLKEEQLRSTTSANARRSHVTSASTPGLMRAPPPTSSTNMGSVSEYLTSMATSFIKTTEQLFNSTHFTKPSNESFYEKLKKAASKSSLYSGSSNNLSHQTGFRERLEGLGWKRGSESNLSSASQKDTSKLD